ncbi:MAG: ribosome silencing factor [Bacteroidia bacterium]|jgi:ribosome-associated protein|nr:ribosome silencing factor [Bacteroidia bacterium]
MLKTGKEQDPVQLKNAIIQGIADKKGKNIVCLNMSRVAGSVCDYFIICEGDSAIQVNTIARSVEEKVMEATGEKVYHHEGFENAEWILLDYVDVVVHIFQPGYRKFYNLESLWADAETEEIVVDNHAEFKIKYERYK